MLSPAGLIKSAYNLFLAGFFARNLLDLISLAYNVIDVVELEPKKNN